jgi:phosphatidylserine decarboxylase
MLKTFTTTEIIAREGWLYVAVIILLLIASYFAEIAFVFMLLILFTALYVYRNPERIANEDDLQAIISPVDGKIVKIDRVNSELFNNESGVLVVIRNLPFNVGLVRFPVNGKLGDVKTIHGLFLPPFNKLSKKLNERVLMMCKQNENSFAMKIRAGMFCRKIHLSSNRGNIKGGARIAFIVDGSVELFLPMNSRIKLSVGDYVKSGESILGYFEK